MFDVKKTLIWMTALLLSIALTVCVFFPARWLGPLLEKQTKGRLILGDAQGSLWQGSAFIGTFNSAYGAITPLLAGRFSWRISPLILLGQVRIRIENTALFSTAVEIHGNWNRWEVSPASLSLPAQYLIGLGAPLNTVFPTGQLKLAWQRMQLTWVGSNRVVIDGRMTLDMLEMASRLSPVKPFGSYRMGLDWRAGQLKLTLSTLQGPLLVSGGGQLENGHFSFSGVAEAAVEQQERLATLLSLLGRPRQMNDRNIVELEFTS